MTGSNANWLFMEPGLSGHHVTYLEHIVSAACEHGLNVTVALGDSEPVRSETGRLRAKFKGVEFVHLPLPVACINKSDGIAGLIRMDLSYWQYFRSVYHALSTIKPIDRVFIPYMDYCLYACGLLGSPFGDVPFEGICMRPSFHFHEMGVVAPRRHSDIIKRYLFGRFLRINTLQQLFTNDESLLRYVQNRLSPSWNKLRHLPEPAEFIGSHTREAARSILGIAPDAHVVLVYGALDERKGIRQLMDGMAQPEAPDNVVLLLVGKCAEDIKTLLHCAYAQTLHKSGRLIILDRRVSGEEEQMCFVAADICWLGYQGHYTMSGVLVKAVHMGNVIITGRDGLMAWYAARLRRAVITDVQSPAAIANALQASVANLNDETDEGDKHIFAMNTWRHCNQILFG